MKRVLLFCLVLLPLLLPAQTPGDRSGRVLLPNGWWLSPAGEQLALGDLPMNAALSPDERYLAVSHSGQSKAELRLVDLKSRTVVQTIRLKDTWLGIRFVGTTLYVSGGYQNCVYTYRLEQGTLVAGDTIVLSPPRPQYNGAVEGLDVRGTILAAVVRNDSTLRLYDLTTKHQRTVRLDGMPYSCLFLPDGKVMVSVWGGRKVAVYDGVTKAFECATGDHPTDMVLSGDAKSVFVACANDNSVSVIDIGARKSIASASTAIHPDAPEGSTTNALALSPTKDILLAANADNNSLTVIDVRNPARPLPVGFIPVGWYPTKVLVLSDGTILVLNGKGGRSLANPKRQYIASLLPGSMSMIPFPDPKQLGAYSDQVLANTPYRKAQLTESGVTGNGPIPHTVGAPSPIKHVFYIIRENRTYDQVLGDVAAGNGDSTLCMFGEAVTPNLHKLVRDYVLFDNFYVNSEVSADGHNWSTAAYATDYIEKTWPTQYGGRGGEYDFEGDGKTGAPTSGYIWNQCKKAGVTYRSYGEFITANDKVGGPGTAREAGLEGQFAPYYRGWDLEYSDVDRIKEWDREFTQFENAGTLPRFTIMHLPNDHTAGTKRGALTPQAYVAQNDYALGLFIERLSKSSIWKESAVFVVEDDAQNGPDHVDAHRSPALVISPYTKRGAADHTLYTTASILRTMELILGMPPMSQYDASATPMAAAFLLSVPDAAPYAVEKPRIDIMAKNKTGDVGQNLMDSFDLRAPDRIPDRLFSEIVWQAVKGTPMPAPRYSVFSRAAAAFEEEENE
jgi:DNA-binding beta-propeller fold protein YncE